MDGQLEFYDTDSSDFTLMASPEHSMATDLEWDPTGRYVVTSVSYWSQKVCIYLVTILYCYVIKTVYVYVQILLVYWLQKQTKLLLVACKLFY